MDFQKLVYYGQLIDDMVQAMDTNIYNRIKYEGINLNLGYQKLNYSQRMLMTACATRENMTMGQCAKVLGINTRSISRPVATLEKLGYLKRENSLTDKKVVNVKVTQLGKETISNHSAFALCVTDVIFSNKFTQDEFMQVIELTEKLLDLFKKLDYDPGDKNERALIADFYNKNKDKIVEKIINNENNLIQYKKP